MIVQIERRVCLPPKFLTKNIEGSILEYLRDSTKTECSRKHGYILSVNKILKIIDNKISPATSDIIYTILMEVETLKPETGAEISGSVCMIYDNGIFLNIKDKLKVLIPIHSLSQADYVFEKEDSVFKKGESIIKMDDDLTVNITGIKYSKSSFSCFGNLVE